MPSGGTLLWDNRRILGKPIIVLDRQAQTAYKGKNETLNKIEDGRWLPCYVRNLSSSPESDASIDGNIRFPTVIKISSVGLCQYSNSKQLELPGAQRTPKFCKNGAVAVNNISENRSTFFSKLALYLNFIAIDWYLFTMFLGNKK